MSDEPTLFVLRLLPAIAATLAASVTVLSFVLFEQRGGETTGISLRVLASLTVALFVSAAVRAWHLHHRTSRVLGGWLATAEEVILPDAAWTA